MGKPTWDSREHIGTAPMYSTDPITILFHGRSKRIGTHVYYRQHWPQCKRAKGFRIRPKWAKYLKEVQGYS